MSEYWEKIGYIPEKEESKIKVRNTPHKEDSKVRNTPHKEVSKVRNTPHKEDSKVRNTPHKEEIKSPKIRKSPKVSSEVKPIKEPIVID